MLHALYFLKIIDSWISSELFSIVHPSYLYLFAFAYSLIISCNIQISSILERNLWSYNLVLLELLCQSSYRTTIEHENLTTKVFLFEKQHLEEYCIEIFLVFGNPTLKMINLEYLLYSILSPILRLFLSSCNRILSFYHNIVTLFSIFLAKQLEEHRCETCSILSGWLSFHHIP